MSLNRQYQHTTAGSGYKLNRAAWLRRLVRQRTFNDKLKRK